MPVKPRWWQTTKTARQEFWLGGLSALMGMGQLLILAGGAARSGAWPGCLHWLARQLACLPRRPCWRLALSTLREDRR